MAVIAHFEDVAANPDRRGAARRALRLGIGGSGAVTIRDMSLTGMLIETIVPMLVGATFEVDLPNDLTVPAVVVWNSGEFYGCEFHQAIPPATLSAAQLLSPPDHPASPPCRDPLTELKEVTRQVDEIASKLEQVIARLGHD